MKQSPRAINLVSERELAATVRELARLYGWKQYSVLDTANPAVRTSTGWPDLFLVKGGQALAVELKTENGGVRNDQDAWLEALEQVPGIRCYVWRPRHLVNGEIEAILGDEATNHG